ncbi:XdhC family protein [Vallicoccus soli]|uniref:XdhC/CoxI family protein n=1 Tax=Vallicoccus soli TaxID=2339232 RepID=A0A3A3Z4R9_9ACTN|nr:XdhC/CoxI family protein [Vallicoccus soli]RJK96728.1 XdhC/CoxI family protein [Vallicoccus soli]
MREVLDDLVRWHREGRAGAVATVVRTWRSAPRAAGAAMAVSADGEVVGSVSGGCVEGALYEVAREVVASGRPVVQRYGVSDDDALAVGLTCGGELEVLVAPSDGALAEEVAAAVAAGEPLAVATLVEGVHGPGPQLVVRPGSSRGSLGGERLDAAVVDDARGLLARGATGTLHLGPDGERRGEGTTVLVQSFAPPPRMLVFGAIDFAAAVARIGAFLGYRVTVCDARPVFATARRLPGADEVVVEWPHRYLARTEVDERTVVCVLTHDPKFDVPLLEVALRTPAAYVGAMGSRRTHEDRLARLRERGLGEAELARLSSPIGLDLGARTPEETAVSVAAEITALRWGGTGRRLSDLSGPVHHDRP